MTDFRIETMDAAAVNAHLTALTLILQDAVKNGAGVSFIAPLSNDDALTYWTGVASDVQAGTRIIVGAWFDNIPVGTAQLVMARVPNGRHRAEVQKVLVHTSYRRRGIGRSLMDALDVEARAHSIRLLHLDTIAHSEGEALYTHTGWQRVGVIPGYAYDSTGTKLVDSVFFYKTLV